MNNNHTPGPDSANLLTPNDLGPPAAAPARNRVATRINRVTEEVEDEALQQVLLAMLAFRSGDFSRRLPSYWTGVKGKVADVFNDILIISERRTKETTRICRMVGKEGRLQQRMSVPGVAGGWAD